jgi:predicted branched-subunit amino acid permease
MALSESSSGLSVYAFWVTALGVYLLWNASTLIGALVGRGLGSPAAAGLDVAGPAAFAALLGPRLRAGRGPRVVAVVAAAAAAACVPVLPLGSPVLAGAGVAALVAVLAARR